MKTFHSKGFWRFHFTSASQARLEANNGTDGGGASGYIQAPTGRTIFGKPDYRIVAFLPHHRDEKEDAERLANARLLAAAPQMLSTLQSLSVALADIEEMSKKLGDVGLRNLIRETIDWISTALNEATG